MPTIATWPANAVDGNGKVPPSPATNVTNKPTPAPANGNVRRQPMLTCQATAMSKRNAATRGLNNDAMTAASVAPIGCRARTARIAANAAVTPQANGARPTMRSPTTKTANHRREMAAGQLSARPTTRPKSAVDNTQARAVAGTVPSIQPTAGNSTL